MHACMPCQPRVVALPCFHVCSLMFKLPPSGHCPCFVGPEAKGHAETFVQTAEALHRHCLTLFEGTSMPRSESTFTG